MHWFIVLFSAHLQEMGGKDSDVIPQMEGVNCSLEDKLFYPEFKKKLTNVVLKHLRCVLNNMAYMTRVPLVVPQDVFDAATDFDKITAKLNCVRGEPVTFAVDNAHVEALKRGFTGKFTPQNVQDLKFSVVSFVKKFGGNPEILDQRYERLFELAEVRKSIRFLNCGPSHQIGCYM
jgi:hypothetical protein